MSPASIASSSRVPLVTISALRPSPFTAAIMRRMSGWTVGSPKPPNMTDSRWGNRFSWAASRSKSAIFMSPRGSFQVFRMQVSQVRLQRDVGSMYSRDRLWMLGRTSTRPPSKMNSSSAPGSRPSFRATSGGTSRQAPFPDFTRVLFLRGWTGALSGDLVSSSPFSV